MVRRDSMRKPADDEDDTRPKQRLDKRVDDDDSRGNVAYNYRI